MISEVRTLVADTRLIDIEDTDGTAFCDASDLMLSPGVWPEKIVIVNNAMPKSHFAIGAGTILTRGDRTERAGELVGVTYVSEDPRTALRRLFVAND
jgi:2-keto-3-deoxy-6-phosphogluconate aldolase